MYSTSLLICAAATSFVAFSGFSQEQRPLTAKVEFRYGPRGPRKPTTIAIHPGETICLTGRVLGLTLSKNGQLIIKYQVELRNNKGELIEVVLKNKANHTPVIGNDALLVSASAGIPIDCQSENMQIWFSVTDLNSGNEVTEKVAFSVMKPESAQASNIYFSLDSEGRLPSTGIYTEGEQVVLHFYISEADRYKTIKCSLELIPEDKTIKTRKLETTIEESKKQKIEPNPEGRFMFVAEQPFKGIARLTVEGEDERIHVTDVPLLVLESLR